jgi:hypothetical protein
MALIFLLAINFMISLSHEARKSVNPMGELVRMPKPCVGRSLISPELQ